MLGVELVNPHSMEHITLPPDIHILHQAWDKYYKTHKLFNSYFMRGRYAIKE